VSNLFIELGRKISAEDYDNPTFSVELLIKDVRLAIDMAKEGGAPPLLAQTVQFLNEVARTQGLGGKDTSVMWKVYGPIWGPSPPG
jgi:3-hydroxyisobutyrate dehydrogenase-like beta-hydroxyacid dehydrogenase